LPKSVDLPLPKIVDSKLLVTNTYSIDAGHLVRAILEDALGREKLVIM
jgi:hypothetical protein